MELIKRKNTEVIIEFRLDEKNNWWVYYNDNNNPYITHDDIIITVTKDWVSKDKYAVFFNNAPCNFGPSPVLRDQESIEAAFSKGIEYIKNHQEEIIKMVGIYRLSVLLWWDGTWSYILYCGGQESCTGFKNKDEAIDAGEKKARDKIVI